MREFFSASFALYCNKVYNCFSFRSHDRGSFKPFWHYSLIRQHCSRPFNLSLLLNILCNVWFAQVLKGQSHDLANEQVITRVIFLFKKRIKS